MPACRIQTGDRTVVSWLNTKEETESEQATIDLARRFGSDLEGPSVILLQGTMGAGKTTFTRGLVVGLGVADPSVVRSPTFTLVNVYSGRLPIYHVDLYRLEHARDLETIGIAELMAEAAFVIVEWAEKLPVLFHEHEAWTVSISDLGGDRRGIQFTQCRQ
jgi:tRNA threonylcarbamoyladenosine biosynthesis protein TsaE